MLPKSLRRIRYCGLFGNGEYVLLVSHFRKALGQGFTGLMSI